MTTASSFGIAAAVTLLCTARSAPCTCSPNSVTEPPGPHCCSLRARRSAASTSTIRAARSPSPVPCAVRNASARALLRRTAPASDSSFADIKFTISCAVP